MIITTTEPNVSLGIYDGVFELAGEQNGAKTILTVDASIFVRWLPRPGIWFRFYAPPPTENIWVYHNLVLKERGFVYPGGKVQCEPFIIDQRIVNETISYNSEGGAQIEVELSRFEQPIKSDTNCVLFHIANLEQIYHCKEDKSSISVERFTLNGGGWRVKIESTRSLIGSNIVDHPLKRHMISGFAITHWGILEREDNHAFSPQAAIELLEGLRYFLSFARGGWCWRCLPSTTTLPTEC